MEDEVMAEKKHNTYVQLTREHLEKIGSQLVLEREEMDPDALRDAIQAAKFFQEIIEKADRIKHSLWESLEASARAITEEPKPSSSTIYTLKNSIPTVLTSMIDELESKSGTKGRFGTKRAKTEQQ